MASAKTANKFGTVANIEAFDANWRCPFNIILRWRFLFQANAAYSKFRGKSDWRANLSRFDNGGRKLDNLAETGEGIAQ